MDRRYRLVVLDLDGTLVCATPETRDGVARHAEAYQNFFIYARPHLEWFLRTVDEDARNIVILFSAGFHEYVHWVVTNVIYPLARRAVPGFSFAAIYTRDDLCDGTKNIASILNEFALEEGVLVDDNFTNLIHSGVQNYLISCFDPFGGEDDALLKAGRFLSAQ